MNRMHAAELGMSIASKRYDFVHKIINLKRMNNTAFGMTRTDTRKIVIHADKSPDCEHVRKFNSPSTD